MPHPYHLPGGLNLFQFSMPYLAEKIIDMLYNIIKHGEEKKDEHDDPVSIDDVMKVLTASGYDLNEG